MDVARDVAIDVVMNVSMFSRFFGMCFEMCPMWEGESKLEKSEQYLVIILVL